MILILYADIKEKLSNCQFNRFLQLLPPADIDKIASFKRWQDAHLCLYGRLLLISGLSQLGYSKELIHEIRSGLFNKPFLPDGPFFNISHSGSIAVCALSNSTKLGIDIEALENIDFYDFKSQWTPEEWNNIRFCDDPIRKFYYYWTRKEAVIKADARGLSLPLHLFTVVKDKTVIAGHEWYLREITINPDYACHLATDSQLDKDPKVVRCSLKESDFI